MEFIVYVLTGILELVLCVILSELLDRKLSKKEDDLSMVKSISSELDSKTEDRLRYSIRKKLKKNKTTQ